MPNNHSTEYELNSTSHETRKSFNFNDPRINDTSGTNFESRKARRGIYLSFDVVIQGKKDLRQRSSQFDSYWWDPLSKKRVKKRKNLLIFSKKGNEIRTRDRSTAIGGWPLPLSKRNSFLRGIAKLYYYAFQRERENLCFSFINNCDFFYRSIRWNSGL